MHSIRIHKVISQVVDFFYYIGLWHRGDEPTTRDMRRRLLYHMFYALYLALTIVGAITNEKVDKKVLLLEGSIVIGVLNVKLGVLIWKQKQILDLLSRICNYTIRYEENLAFCNDKIGKFIKFVIAFFVMVIIGCVDVLFLPLVRSEKNLVLEVAFPWDYKKSEIAFWIVHIFTVLTTVLSTIVSLFSMMTWYLLLSCSLRYDMLGRELKRIGQISEQIKMPEKQKHKIFRKDLAEYVDVHLYTRELTDEVSLFFSEIFLIQFGTSGLCICASIYCLVFNVGDNLLDIVVLAYSIADLYLITYFGNEITLSSNRLSYSLFESEWTELPQTTKNCIIVFGEYLKQPHELLIGKLYPLTLETFTRILNSAYSMFNILKTYKK